MFLFSERARCQTLLIHGSTVGIKYSVFRDRKIQDGSFTAFQHLLDTGKAQLFTWYLPGELDFWSCLSPKTLVETYQRERVYIHSSDQPQKLYLTLRKLRPHTVIAHSMGCELLQLSINRYGIPGKIKHILTLMSDAPANMQIDHLQAKQLLSQKRLRWDNYYCPWDQALIASKIVNGRNPAGLVGSKDPLINNVFFS